METALNIDVSALDLPHRQALEDVIGRKLASDQRLIISVVERGGTSAEAPSRPRQTLEDWTSVYEGLSEPQIEEIDAIAKERANLTRDLDRWFAPCRLAHDEQLSSGEKSMGPLERASSSFGALWIYAKPIATGQSAAGH